MLLATATRAVLNDFETVCGLYMSLIALALVLNMEHARSIGRGKLPLEQMRYPLLHC